MMRAWDALTPYGKAWVSGLVLVLEALLLWG